MQYGSFAVVALHSRTDSHVTYTTTFLSLTLPLFRQRLKTILIHLEESVLKCGAIQICKYSYN